MKRKGNGMRLRLAGGILAALTAALAGCGAGEQTKTVVLPSLTKGEIPEADPFEIRHIREYVGSVYPNDAAGLVWGNPETDFIYVLEKDSEGNDYYYQTVDIQTNQILSVISVENRPIWNIAIAPGGQFFSYETEEGGKQELVLFIPGKDNCRQILRSWEDPEEIYSYLWSDDGMRLLSWQSGDTKDPYADWAVTCYLMDDLSDSPDGSFRGTKSEFLLAGSGPSWRMVLPNADGSEIYVREQFKTFGSAGTEGDGRDSESAVAGEEEGPIACNWLFRSDSNGIEALAEYSTVPVQPLKYTTAGLFVLEENGGLSLVRDLRWQPEKKTVIPGDWENRDPIFRICENGDHVFLLEWLDDAAYQISGMKVGEGDMGASPAVLYRGQYDSLTEISVLRDRAVCFWRKEGNGDEWYHYKITALEY
ncbi:MAG: hypothetical protein NC541_00560 [bacterium]|nr:hypothetical protein [bacterium]